MTDQSMGDRLQATIRTIVVEGKAVRDRVADAVAQTVAGTRDAAHGVADVVQRTAAGAIEGARTATADSKRGVLRDVVSGVGDGLARAALAAKLAFEEARRRGAGFARRDLERVVTDLSDSGTKLVESFVTTVANAGGEFGDQARTLREHAERVVAQVEPGIRTAVTAVKDDPLGLASDTVKAGTGAVRQASGELFAAASGLLGEAAKRLRSPR